MHTDYDELSDDSIHPDECDNLPPSSPPPSSPYATAGRYQYNHLCQDIRRSMASELATRKRARDDYETVGEADDIEAGMVDERYRSRIHVRIFSTIPSSSFSHTFHIAGYEVHPWS
jgi:hypothetical protein